MPQTPLPTAPPPGLHSSAVQQGQLQGETPEPSPYKLLSQPGSSSLLPSQGCCGRKRPQQQPLSLQLPCPGYAGYSPVGAAALRKTLEPFLRSPSPSTGLQAAVCCRARTAAGTETPFPHLCHCPWQGCVLGWNQRLSHTRVSDTQAGRASPGLGRANELCLRIECSPAQHCLGRQ